MKKSFRFLMFVFCLSVGIGLAGCSSGENEDILNNNVGIHKIEIAMNGDEGFHYTASFAGASVNGVAKLYSLDGTLKQYEGETFLIDGDMPGTKKIICYTENNATLLATSFGFVCSADGLTLSYTIKAYVDDKLVNEVSRVFTSEKGNRVGTVSLSTGKNL